jgi:predicted nucleic acid-binding protein
MTGEVLVDTNVLIHHWNGDPRTTILLDDKKINVSFVTEIEVFGFHGYTAKERALVSDDLKLLHIVDLSSTIKVTAIDLRARYRLKLADALITNSNGSCSAAGH